MSGGDLQVELRPELLRWARERAHLTSEELARKTGVKATRVDEWEATGRLRIRHIERVANATHTPVGMLYLEEPPIERLPLPDFRLLAGQELERPSPDLLDVIDDVLTRQSWYREYAQSSGFEPLDFVGRLTPDVDPVVGAAQIRERHGLTPELRASAASWEEALRLEVDRIESTGVLVMRNGVVGNNTSRPLDVGEFRGFAISDDFAPVIFLNGRDAKAAQMFTLMHELVHIWLGRSGVSNLNMTLPAANETERVSNRVAAEILVPRSELDDAWVLRRGNPSAVSQLARLFKVSSLVILRRLFDTGHLDGPEFHERYAAEEDRFLAAGGRDDTGGGDFYRTQTIRTSRRFATTLIGATLEGKTSRRDAFRLLGIRSPATFEEFARRLGLVA